MFTARNRKTTKGIVMQTNISIMRTLSLAIIAAGTCITALLLVSPLQAADWLQQGGPNRDGIVPPETAGKLASSFPDQKVPLLWKTTVGLGTAPVVVSDGKIYTFGQYKHGTPMDKLNDPSFVPDGNLVGNMRGIVEKLAQNTNLKGSVCFPEMLKKPELEKQLPAELQGHLVMLGDVPGVSEWAGKLDASGWPTYDHDDVYPLYRCDEYALCLDAATGKIIWATKLTEYGLAGNIFFGGIARHYGWEAPLSR